MKSVLFMGRKPVAARALRWLSAREDVTVVGVITDSHLAVSPTSEVAREAGIPIYTREQVEGRVQSGILRFDLAVSVLYWQKIRSPILAACSNNVVNFHPAPLPEYKGTAGYNLAILEALDRWAVTAHYVDHAIDTGDIIEVRGFPIDRERETAQTIEAKCQTMLYDQFVEVVARMLLAAERLPTTPNIGGRLVTRAEMEAMKELRPGDDVERKIRAFWFPPYDGAFVMVDGVKCTLVSRPILASLANPAGSNLFTPAATKR